MHRRRLIGALAAGAATALAGCTTGTGGGSDPTTDTTTSANTTTATTAASDATVTVRSTDQYGDVLAGPDGRSLYLFTQDDGSTSTCYDGCAQTWPPLTVDGEPAAGDGVTASLGTTERDDGSTQVTAAGHPLYYYAGDSAPGDTTGQDVGGVWFLLAPDGTAIEGASTASDTTTEDDSVY